MFIIDGEDDGAIDYSVIDDITLLFMKNDGDGMALAELEKRHPDLANPREVGSEANVVQGEYSQRVIIKSARGDGYYQVENLTTGKVGWVKSDSLE